MGVYGYLREGNLEVSVVSETRGVGRWEKSYISLCRGDLIDPGYL